MNISKGKNEWERTNLEKESRFKRFAFNTMKKATEGIMMVTISLAVVTGTGITKSNNIYGDEKMAEIQIEKPNVKTDSELKALQEVAVNKILEVWKEGGKVSEKDIDIIKKAFPNGDVLVNAVKENSIIKGMIKNGKLTEENLSDYTAPNLFTEKQVEGLKFKNFDDDKSVSYMLLVIIATYHKESGLINTERNLKEDYNKSLESLLNSMFSFKREGDERFKIAGSLTTKDTEHGITKTPDIIYKAKEENFGIVKANNAASHVGGAAQEMNLNNTGNWSEKKSIFSAYDKNGKMISSTELQNFIDKLNQDTSAKGDEKSDMKNFIDKMEELKKDIKELEKIAQTGSYLGINYGGEINFGAFTPKLSKHKTRYGFGSFLLGAEIGSVTSGRYKMGENEFGGLNLSGKINFSYSWKGGKGLNILTSITGIYGYGAMAGGTSFKDGAHQYGGMVNLNFDYKNNVYKGKFMWTNKQIGFDLEYLRKLKDGWGIGVSGGYTYGMMETLPGQDKQHAINPALHLQLPEGFYFGAGAQVPVGSPKNALFTFTAGKTFDLKYFYMRIEAYLKTGKYDNLNDAKEAKEILGWD